MISGFPINMASRFRPITAPSSSSELAASFVTNHFLYHDSMPAGPLLGDSAVSFLGFSIRNFKWQFMHESPVKLYVVPIWFILLGLTILTITIFKMGRRKTDAPNGPYWITRVGPREF